MTEMSQRILSQPRHPPWAQRPAQEVECSRGAWSHGGGGADKKGHLWEKWKVTMCSGGNENSNLYHQGKEGGKVVCECSRGTGTGQKLSLEGRSGRVCSSEGQKRLMRAGGGSLPK